MDSLPRDVVVLAGMPGFRKAWADSQKSRGSMPVSLDSRGAASEGEPCEDRQLDEMG